MNRFSVLDKSSILLTCWYSSRIVGTEVRYEYEHKGG